MNPDKPPRLAWEMWKRFLIGGAVLVALTAATVATAVLLEVKDVAQALELGGPKLDAGGELTRADVGEPQTILLIGSDVRFASRNDKNDRRSDTLILVRLDPDRKITSVLSIPRDLKVEIPYRGQILTNKINYAYSLGGPKLSLKVVKRLTGLDVNHIVDVNFDGFARAVNRIGCVYMDVDRRYFHSNAGLGASQQYAEIDIPAGYQRLCGQDALDFVRYRHEDNDIVRGARQQQFLSEAKQQVGAQKLFGDRKALVRIFGRYTRTDIRGTKEVLKLLELAVFSAQNPVREVRFPAQLGGADATYVTASDSAIRRAAGKFLRGEASGGSRADVQSTASERKAERQRRKRRNAKRPKVAPGLVDARVEGENQAIPIAGQTGFPVYFPRYRTTGGTYMTTPGTYPRVYKIESPGGRKRYGAYRMVVRQSNGGFYEYYGVQGTTWKTPPILQKPSESRKVDGRRLLLYYDGNRLRMVAWKTRRASCWISNTLLRSLSNQQMLGIARSLRRLG